MDKRPEADAGSTTQGGPGPSRAVRRRRVRTPEEADAEARGGRRHAPCEHGNPPVGEAEGGLGAGPVSGRRLLRGHALGGRGDVRLGYCVGPPSDSSAGPSSVAVAVRPGSWRTASRRVRPVGRAAPGPPSPAPRGRRSRWARVSLRLASPRLGQREGTGDGEAQGPCRLPADRRAPASPSAPGTGLARGSTLCRPHQLRAVVAVVPEALHEAYSFEISVA